MILLNTCRDRVLPGPTLRLARPSAPRRVSAIKRLPALDIRGGANFRGNQGVHSTLRPDKGPQRAPPRAPSVPGHPKTRSA